jgi:hypothetical protein
MANLKSYKCHSHDAFASCAEAEWNKPLGSPARQLKIHLRERQIALSMYENQEESFAETQGLLSLIELIYDAADDAALWPVVLGRIAESVQANISS